MSRMSMCAILVALVVGGVSIAGPFSRCRPCVSPPTWSYGSPVLYPPSATPAPESKAEEQAVPPVSSQPVAMPSTSPVPDIVGQQRPDTGSPSLIGLLREGGKLKVEIPDLSKLSLPEVKLSVPLPEKTSASFESVADRLHTSLTFLQVMAGTWLTGTFGRWVMQAASGLAPFFGAVSSALRERKSGAKTR